MLSSMALAIFAASSFWHPGTASPQTCDSAFQASSPHSTGVFAAEDGAVCFDDAITDDSIEHVLNLLQASVHQPPRLIVRSRGGDAFSGLDLAEFILEERVEVRIVDVCASSCANYVFLPAVHGRSVASGGLILFHGGISIEFVSSARRGVETQLREAGAPDDVIAAEQARLVGQIEQGLMRQRALLDALGLPWDLLEAHHVMSASVDPDDCVGDGPAQFTPTTQWLAHFGLELEGDPLSSIETLAGSPAFAEANASLCPLPVFRD